MSDKNKAAALAELAQRIKRLEQVPQSIGPRRPMGFSFGVPAMDDVVVSAGFPFAGLHEVLGQTSAADFAAANAFVAVTAAGLKGGVLWCVGRSQLYAPAISAFGLSASKVYYFYANSDEAALSAMEEGLRCATLAAVVGEVNRMSLTASRRLILASEKSGVPAFVLRPPVAKMRTEHIACGTRWRLAVAPSSPVHRAWIGHSRWVVELLRCRGSRTGQWLVETNDASGHLCLSQALADRSAAATFGAQQRRFAG